MKRQGCYDATFGMHSAQEFLRLFPAHCETATGITALLKTAQSEFLNLCTLVYSSLLFTSVHVCRKFSGTPRTSPSPVNTLEHKQYIKLRAEIQQRHIKNVLDSTVLNTASIVLSFVSLGLPIISTTAAHL